MVYFGNEHKSMFIEYNRDLLSRYLIQPTPIIEPIQENSSTQLEELKKEEELPIAVTATTLFKPQ